MSKRVGIILVNYKDYAQRFLADCRDSLRAQNYPDFQVYLVDNATTAESEKYLRENFAEAKIIANQNNDGFAKGNNDGMKAAMADGCDYVLLLNLDTVIEPQALSEMVKAAEADEKIGAVQARLMLFSQCHSREGGNPVLSSKVNSLGNSTHFLGFGYSLGYGEEWKENNSHFEPCNSKFEIMYPSGAAVLFKKSALDQVGLLDEEYWMYNEDQELGWRLWLSGWKCVLAPDAVVYHKYEFSRSANKYYWLDRNRILAILECYDILTLILIAPAFMIMEFGLTLFSLQSGWFGEKMKVWNYFLSYDNWEYIKKARARNQGLRKVSDKEITRLITGKIWYQEVADWKLRLINPIFSAYWQLARAVLKFF
ncbi:MAG: glycosyltransferase family 2 protein [Patescibacteria group bacterium]|nr:glycosyltransferase family 2 protein [Patescibacteria group bacterium]